MKNYTAWAVPIDRRLEMKIAALSLTLILTIVTGLAAERVYPPALFPITYQLNTSGELAMVLEDSNGNRIRNLVAQVARGKGVNREMWNCQNQQGIFVSPGKYKWRAIYAPPLELHYQQTVYPNVEAHSPGRLPWNRGPQDGFLGNHGNLVGVCAVGDLVYMTSGGTEGGHALLAANLKGQKLWGSGAGANHLFTDGKTLFAESSGVISRIDGKTRKRTIVHRRAGTAQWLTTAAHGNRIYIVSRVRRAFFNNALGSTDVDLTHIYPTLPTLRRTKEFYGIAMRPQQEFLRLFRLTGKPPGSIAPEGMRQLISTRGASGRQFIVLSFKKSVALGTLLLPATDSGHPMQLSILRPNAPFPPLPGEEKYWQPLPSPVGTHGWRSVTLPPGSATRALRITFSKEGSGLPDLLIGKPGVNDVKNIDIDAAFKGVGKKTKGVEDLLGGGVAKAKRWAGSLSGMRILKRRFKNHFPRAKIFVNDGDYNATTGVWDAWRETVVTPSSPGIFAMSWEQPIAVRGLAFKEIGGARTEIDVYTGPAGKPISPETKAGWEQVATYRQPIRNGAHNSGNNQHARYLDGIVDFGEPRRTRAIRLRVVEPQTGGGTADDRVDNAAKRCKLYGVAVLEALEDDHSDNRTQLLEVRDGTTGELIRSLKTDVNGRMTFAPDRTLHGIVDGKVWRINLQTGKPIAESAPGVKQPFRLATDARNHLYVFDNDPGRRNVRVYDATGEFLRAIGKPGLRRPGLWEPDRLHESVSISVDKLGQLWSVYPHENPRRIVQFDADGTFAREFLGNTHYGGGGTLDRYDKARAYYKTMEFFVDWQGRDSRMNSELIDKYWQSSPWWAYSFRSDLTAVKANGRRYLVTQSQVVNPFRLAGFVYLVNEKTRAMRLVAGAGVCTAGDFFRTPEWAAHLDGKPLQSLKFIWADTNGDQLPQPTEVKLSPNDNQQVSRFNLNLSLTTNTGHYRVKTFSADGVPCFEEVLGPGGHLMLTNGNYLQLGHGSDPGKSVNRVVTPEGRVLWAYPAWNGVSGLWIPDWSPGYVANQLVISGHETATAGELGEFFVVGANTGQMNLWTADGLLAGRVAFHTRDPARKGLPASNERGTRMDGLTLRQEHFHSFFTKTEQDNRYYINVGDDTISFIEVRGLAKYKRLAGEIDLTRADIEKARAHVAGQLARRLDEKPLVQNCPAGPLKIDGVFETDELLATTIDRNHRAQFRCSHDAQQLYLSFRVEASGPFQNRGEDFRRIFKTGAAVDIKIGTDPKANPRRIAPVIGDLRLVLAFDNDQPHAILYRPKLPTGPGEHAWKITTPAGGETAFDEVRELKNLKLLRGGAGQATIVEAAIPLEELGLKPMPNAKLKFDWGFLTTDDGIRTAGRNAWANRTAVGVTDAPIEARINPSLWGTLQFGVPDKQPGDKLAKQPVTLDELLDQKIKFKKPK